MAIVMLYGANGGDKPHTARVLLATSEDGITWEKQGRVMEPELCGGLDSDYIAIPRLFAVDDGFFALTVLSNDMAALRSQDAVEWTCAADGPVFLGTDIEGSDRVHTLAAAEVGEDISVMIEARVRGRGWRDLHQPLAVPRSWASSRCGAQPPTRTRRLVGSLPSPVSKSAQPGSGSGSFSPLVITEPSCADQLARQRLVLLGQLRDASSSRLFMSVVATTGRSPWRSFRTSASASSMPSFSSARMSARTLDLLGFR